MYLAALSASESELQTCRDLLDSHELARADRFLDPRHREQFYLSHGILRLLLSRYLAIPAKAVTFTFGDQQKPHLHTPTHQLKFNLSHSGQYALYAFAADCELGVDIEKIQSDHKMDVAERFFSSSEITAMRAAPESQRAALFFEFWSKKEAIIKANGRGLTQPLSSFAVNTGSQPEIVSADDSSWYLYSLPVHADYAAALAASTSLNRLVISDVTHLQPKERSNEALPHLSP